MSMFDYDTRPATPGVVLVDTGTSAAAYRIRDFLSRNSCQYEWVDVTNAERVRSVLGSAELDPRSLPICVLPDGTQLSPATLEQVAAGLGMVSGPSRSEYDLTIVGAGPAGLAAAVYAASEGLRTLVLEAIAPGGQAGTTSMIENYLGFPNGISGSELATRGWHRLADSEQRYSWHGRWSAFRRTVRATTRSCPMGHACVGGHSC